MILVDTPIWSLALRRRTGDLSVEQRMHVGEWEHLVRSGDIILIGAIRQELLSGVRDRTHGSACDGCFVRFHMCRSALQHTNARDRSSTNADLPA